MGAFRNLYDRIVLANAKRSDDKISLANPRDCQRRGVDLFCYLNVHPANCER